MELKSLNDLIEIAKQKPKKKIAVAAAADEPVLQAVADAMQAGIADPILVGNEKNIRDIAAKINFNLDNVEVINEENAARAAIKCVKIIRDGEAQIIMKGLVATADYLRAILNKEHGLRKGSLLSHIGFFEVPVYHKLLALTDAAQNIAPNLMEKVGILNNSIDMFHHLGIEKPKVAMLGAVETVNPKMESTIDSAAITQMYRRGQIKDCMIDGPLAFDNTISMEATKHKGIVSEVAGDADLLFAPNIEVGNVLYKCFTYFGGATVAAVILGASVPVVLTSRADSDKSKLMSLALAASY